MLVKMLAWSNSTYNFNLLNLTKPYTKYERIIIIVFDDNVLRNLILDAVSRNLIPGKIGYVHFGGYDARVCGAVQDGVRGSRSERARWTRCACRPCTSPFERDRPARPGCSRREPRPRPVLPIGVCRPWCEGLGRRTWTCT